MTIRFAILALLPGLILSSAPAQAAAEASSPAPYLLAGAPTFDLTVVMFRERFNAHNPALQIGEFRAVDSRNDGINLTRAASKINETLYASTALEKGTGKIKTLQLTYLAIEGGSEKAARAVAVNYMAALLREFEPALTPAQSSVRVNDLLTKGKGSHFYQQTLGAVRYVVADKGDKGLTFAIEPIKLALSGP